MIPHMDALRERGGRRRGYGVGPGQGVPSGTGLQLDVELLDDVVVDLAVADGAGVDEVGVTTASGRAPTVTCSSQPRPLVGSSLANPRSQCAASARISWHVRCRP